MKLNKGITLVALVITIIILLILSSVAINEIKSNGLIDKSASTIEKYNKKNIEEEYTLLVDQYRVEELADKNINFKQFMLNNGASNVDREDNVYTIEYKGLTFTEIMGEAELISGIESINLTFDDLISSSELKINANVLFEEGKTSSIIKYKYSIYKDDNLFIQKIVTESNCVIDGLTPNEDYKISVSVYDDAAKKFNSDMVDYRKLPVYEWKKYKPSITHTYYTVQNKGEEKVKFSTGQTYSTVSNINNCFNQNTGVWTADGTLCVEPQPTLPGLTWKFRNNNILINNKIYVPFDYSSGSGNGGKYYDVTAQCTVYESKQNNDYANSGELIDNVKSNNENEFSNAEGGGYKEGYWYVRAN